MPRRTPSRAVADAAPLVSRRSTSLPTEPYTTPGAGQLQPVRSPLGAGRFSRDVFTFDASDLATGYRTTARPAVGSQQVLINGGLVLSSADIPLAPCYFDPDDPRHLVLRPAFPASNGDTVVVRYVASDEL